MTPQELVDSYYLIYRQVLTKEEVEIYILSLEKYVSRDYNTEYTHNGLCYYTSNTATTADRSRLDGYAIWGAMTAIDGTVAYKWDASWGKDSGRTPSRIEMAKRLIAELKEMMKGVE